jgi:hypothetical protein
LVTTAIGLITLGSGTWTLGEGRLYNNLFFVTIMSFLLVTFLIASFVYIVLRWLRKRKGSHLSSRDPPAGLYVIAYAVAVPMYVVWFFAIYGLTAFDATLFIFPFGLIGLGISGFIITMVIHELDKTINPTDYK